MRWEIELPEPHGCEEGGGGAEQKSERPRRRPVPPLLRSNSGVSQGEVAEVMRCYRHEIERELQGMLPLELCVLEKLG